MAFTRVAVTLSYLVVVGQSKMEPFIVGGDDAKIIDFPYAAYLGVECVDVSAVELDSWICGASILNQHIILTAAHCVYGCMEGTQIIVSVGHETTLKGAIATGHSFLIHEHFSNIWITNDIALVRITTPLRFNLNSISRVALMENPPYMEEARLAGWGLVGEKPQTTSQDLKFIKQYTWKKQDCLNLLKRMPDGTFCAKSEKESSHASEGDSGSALVVQGYIQIGLVSFRSSKVSSSITVYTDTGYFYSWIMDKVNKIMCQKY